MVTSSGKISDGLKAPLAICDSCIALIGGIPRFFHCVTAIGSTPTAAAIFAWLPK